MIKAEFTFGSHFQEDMLSLMMKDLSFTEKAIKFVPQERLFSEAYVFIFDQIKEKFSKSGTAPSMAEIEDRIKAKAIWEEAKGNYNKALEIAHNSRHGYNFNKPTRKNVKTINSVRVILCPRCQYTLVNGTDY